MATKVFKAGADGTTGMYVGKRCGRQQSACYNDAPRKLMASYQQTWTTLSFQWEKKR